MSSLNAAQADGYYVPPAYLESGKYKKQSLNQFAGSKGHNQYLQRSVVRFELPYDGFCLGCGAHVGRGTRFNAHKAHVDDYHTTKIWEFTMKCRACAETKFRIRTDPQNAAFVYVEGIKKKVEEFDTVEAGTAGVIDTDVGGGIHPSVSLGSTDASNPLAKLEKSVVGERKAMTERDQMEALLRINAGTTYDDAASNAALRSAYRSARKAKKRRMGAAAAAGLGRGIEVADATEEDASAARSAFDGVNAQDKRARLVERESFSKLRSGSIFCSGKGKRGQRRNHSLPRGAIGFTEKSAVAATGTTNQSQHGGSSMKSLTVSPRNIGTDTSTNEARKHNEGDGVSVKTGHAAKEPAEKSPDSCASCMEDSSALAALTAYSSDSD